VKSIGAYLLLFGIGTFILHAMGMEFRLMRVFGENQNLAAAGMTVLGAILYVIGMKQGAASSEEQPTNDVTEK